MGSSGFGPRDRSSTESYTVLDALADRFRAEVAATPIESLYSIDRPAILRDFFEALIKMGFEDFFSRGDLREPNKLQYVSHEDGNFQEPIRHGGRDLVKNAYEDSGAHRMVSMAILFHPGERMKSNPLHECTALFPEVEDVISRHGPEVRDAFELVFAYSKQQCKNIEAVNAKPPLMTWDEVNKPYTAEDGQKLKAAFELIWNAYPETDPRIIEGADYALSSLEHLIDKSKSYRSWVHNDSRSDYDVTSRFAHAPYKAVRWGNTLTSAQAAAITEQSARNVAQLQPYATRIAERVLAWHLKGVYKLDHNYATFEESTVLARTILNSVAKGETQSGVAEKINKGTYGKLLGERSWLQNDDNRTNALATAKLAPQYLALAVSLDKGEWFGLEQTKLLTLAQMIAATTPAPAAPQPL